MTEMKVGLTNKNISLRLHGHASDIGMVNPENHFPITLMNILDDGEFSSIISWIPSSSGGGHDDPRAFVITDRRKFARVVMPRFFKKDTKYPSFARRLKRWSFTHTYTGKCTGSIYSHSHSMFVKGNRRLCLLMRPRPQVSYKKETKGPQRNPRNPQGLPQALKLGTTKGNCGGISGDAHLPMTGRPVLASSRHGNRGWWTTTAMLAEANCPLLNLPPPLTLPSPYASRLSFLTPLSRQTVDRNAGMSLLADTANVITNCSSSAGEQQLQQRRPSGALPVPVPVGPTSSTSMLNIHELQLQLQPIQTGRDHNITTCQQSYSRLPFRPHACGTPTPTQPACDVGISRSRILSHHHQGGRISMHYGGNNACNNGNNNAPSVYFDSLSSTAPLDAVAVNVVPASSNGGESMLFCDDQQEMARCRSAYLGSTINTTYLPLVIGNRNIRETGWYRNNQRRSIANYRV